MLLGMAGTAAFRFSFLLSLPAGLAFVPFIPATEVGAVQQIIYGLAMTLLMIFRPAGLVGDLSKGKATA